jgi:post-segregation antitoxin (ccd killing protein)
VIKRAQYDQYLQAKAELEATPEWQAKVAKARAESRAYDQHRKRVDDAMTLNGQTY